jgi:serine/threonine protein phosphatase PrpC
VINLTQHQQRKPILGSGDTEPVPFRQPVVPGILLLATDGLLKYTSTEKIISVCRENPVALAAPRLLELVRYPSGAYPDDVTFIMGES